VRLNIGSRLTLGFVLIILSMLGGDAVVLWQFNLVRAQAERLNGFDQKLVSVLRVHTSLLAFHDRLEALADSEDAGQLVAEAGPLRTAFLSEMQRAEIALSYQPSDPQRDPSILPTLEVIQSSLQSQLEAITSLATAGDWSAVHIRLATEVHPLESLTSSLVEKVDHEVDEEQAQTILNIRRVEQRVFLLVPVTAVLTLLIAGALGLSITRSISHPLAQLVEGSRRLARGEFQHQVPVSGEDELAHLGQVFNQTARQLRDLYATLQSSEDQLRRVINTIPALVISALPDGTLDFVNERMVEYTGSSIGDLSGWNWAEIVHPDDLRPQAAAWRKALECGQPMDAEVRIRRADGEYRWFLARNVPLRDDLGNIVRWYGTIIDIEDRKRVEAQLQRSEAYLAEAQRLSHTGSFGRNVSSGEIHWSDETYRIFEIDQSVKPTLELLFEGIHPDDRHHVQQTIDRATGERIDFDIECRFLRPDGLVKYLHIVAQALEHASGGLEFVGAVTDITERKRSEEALRLAQDDLARINRATTMGELTASLAHELSQPISGAMTNANVCLRSLERDTADLDAVRKAVSRIARDAQRAAEIIGRIRSQFERGALNRGAVDVNEIIPETITLLRDEAARYKISVRTELAADLPQIVADRVQLQQVAMNLIINSIEAMKDVDGIREMIIKSQRAENEQILVSFSDTGIGLPPQLAEQIFDPFFTTKPHGTGMGLRISRSIIESHGGRLWAVGSTGRGATFHLNLPAAIPSPR
jgi:PAS domain S-box-containing protein